MSDQAVKEKPDIQGLKFPDPGETKYFVDQRGWRISIEIDYDHDPQDPTQDDDCAGTIHGFLPRKTSYWREVADMHLSPDELFEYLDETYGPRDIGWVQLGYYEHGLCSWFVHDSAPPGAEFRWDGTRLGGIWLPNEYIKEEAQKLPEEERKAYIRQRAAWCAETYTQWCNGAVYGYVVQIHEKLDACEKCGHSEFEEKDEDSCWGFFGYPEVQDEIKAHLRYNECLVLTEVDEDWE